jgi:hypothetical protein
MNPETEKRWSNVFVIHLVGFLFSLHAALPAYIYSTFLSHYTSENLVGVFYSVSAILSILAFALIPSILRKFGNYRTMLYLLYEKQDEWGNLAAPLSPEQVLTYFQSYAGQLGLDVNKFSKAVETNEAINIINEDISAGTASGVNATPTFYVNNTKITEPSFAAGSQSYFQAALDAAENLRLKRAAHSPFAVFAAAVGLAEHGLDGHENLPNLGVRLDAVHPLGLRRCCCSPRQGTSVQDTDWRGARQL